MNPNFPGPAPVEDMDRLSGVLNEVLSLVDSNAWSPTKADDSAAWIVAEAVGRTAVGVRWPDELVEEMAARGQILIDDPELVRVAIAEAFTTALSKRLSEPMRRVLTAAAAVEPQHSDHRRMWTVSLSAICTGDFSS